MIYKPKQANKKNRSSYKTILKEIKQPLTNRWNNKNNRSNQTNQIKKQNIHRQIAETNKTAQEQIKTTTQEANAQNKSRHTYTHKQIKHATAKHIEKQKQPKKTNKTDQETKTYTTRSREQTQKQIEKQNHYKKAGTQTKQITKQHKSSTTNKTDQ